MLPGIPAESNAIAPVRESAEQQKTANARVIYYYDAQVDLYAWRIDAIDKSDGVQYTMNCRCRGDQKEQGLDLLRGDWAQFIKSNGLNPDNLYAPPALTGAWARGVLEVAA